MTVNKKNTRTAFGKFFYKLRHDREQTISEAAKLLNISISYISCIEYGKREIPDNLPAKIIKCYNLNEEEKKTLTEAIKNTPSKSKLSLHEIEYSIHNFIMNVATTKEERDKMELIMGEFLKTLKIK